jgi:hypothetical protein
MLAIRASTPANFFVVVVRVADLLQLLYLDGLVGFFRVRPPA